MTEVQLRRQPEALVVKGNAPLSGEVELHGSKKSLPKLMLAASLTDDPCLLDNVSWIEDVEVAAVLLSGFGRRVRRSGRQLEVSGPLEPFDDLRSHFEAVGRISRVPILSAGPQLARLGEAWIPPLGGDPIGPRGLDVHLTLLRRFGARLELQDGWLRATAAGLCGASCTLQFPMVGVTEHALLTGAAVSGRTEILNAAVDPEIEELGHVLEAMGASVEIDASRRRVVVEGREVLSGFSHTVHRDRIEAGSWASLALATKGDLVLKGIGVAGMAPFVAAFRSAGGEVAERSDGIRFTGSTRTHAGVRIESGPWPGYESDWHPPMLTALTQVNGVSSIHETVFENRFTTVASLRKMGAEIQLEASCGQGREPCRLGAEGKLHRVLVSGPKRLSSGRYAMVDLRGGFGLVAAALAAGGESVLTGSEILQRGYEDLPRRIREIGGSVHVAG